LVAIPASLAAGRYDHTSNEVEDPSSMKAEEAVGKAASSLSLSSLAVSDRLQETSQKLEGEK
jgi:hypothetical protein